MNNHKEYDYRLIGRNGLMLLPLVLFLFTANAGQGSSSPAQSSASELMTSDTPIVASLLDTSNKDLLEQAVFYPKNSKQEITNTTLRFGKKAYLMDEARYEAKLKPNLADKEPIQYRYEDHAISLTPTGFSWLQKGEEKIAAKEGVRPVTGRLVRDGSEIEGGETNVSLAGKGLIYEDAYGKGIGLGVLTKNLVLRKIVKVENLGSLGRIPEDAEFLTFGFELGVAPDIHFKAKFSAEEEQIWDKKTTVISQGEFIEISRGEHKSFIKPAHTWDSAGNRISVALEFKNENNRIILTKRIPRAWLKGAVFPIFADADIAFGTPVIFQSSASTPSDVTALDSTHILVVNGSNAYIGTVSGDSVSFGAAIPLGISPARVATLDSTHVVFIYSASGTAVVGTVSVAGNSVSLGAAVTPCSIGYALNFGVTAVDSTHVVALIDDGANDKTYAVAGEISGTNISFGSCVSLIGSYGSAENGPLDVCTLDSTHVAIGYTGWTSGAWLGRGGFARVGTVSGTTLSVGALAMFDNGNDGVSNSSRAALSIGCLDSTHFVVVSDYFPGGHAQSAWLGTVSGTSISYGALTATGQGACNPVRFVDASHFVCAGSTGDAVYGTVSGTSISFGAAVTFEPDNAANYRATFLDTTHFAIAYRDSGNTYGTAVIGKLPAIDISGTCKQADQSSDCTDTGTIKFAYNGTLQAGTQETVGATWTISTVTPPSAGDVVTIFIDGVAGSESRAAAVTVYDGTGNITGVELIEGRLSLGSADNATLTNTNLSQYDNSVSADADIFFEVDAGNDLAVDTNSSFAAEELYIKAGNTYRPDSTSSGNVTTHHIEIGGTFTADGNTINVAGNWDNNGTFNANTSTVNLNGTSQTIYDSSSFYNLRKIITTTARTLTFDNGTTQTIAAGGKLTLKGESGVLLSLRTASDNGTDKFTITDNGSEDVRYCNVKDSNATNAITALESTNGTGNNANWTFATSLNVNSTADTDTLGTLRYALNNVANGQTIVFDPAIFPATISPGSVLPTLDNNNVTIDASDVGVIISGTSAGAVDGLTVSGTGNVIKGLTIRNFGDDGISVTAGGNTFGGVVAGEANTIDTNGGDGIEFTASSGTDTISTNTIASNTGYAINLASNSPSVNFAGTVDINSDDINLAAGAINLQSATLQLQGNWSNTGVTVTAGTSTLVLDGAADQTITTNNQSFNIVTINNTGASGSDDIVISGTFTVGGTLTITDGDLEQGANNFVLAAVSVGASGSWTNTSTGDVTLSGDVANAGTITLDSSDDAGNGIVIASSDGATQRNWQGAGVFIMTDVNASYQKAVGGSPANIIAASSNDGLNNSGWIFVTSYLQVGSTADNNNPGTLRYALNNVAAGQTITFHTTVFPSATPATITTTSALPTLDDGTVTINASNAGVIINGASAGAGVDGLTLASTGNIIKGLRITGFTRDGILISSGGNTIGGAAAGEPNQIYSNGDDGIQFTATSGGTTYITNNYIGTTSAIANSPNTNYGIQATGTAALTINGGNYIYGHNGTSDAGIYATSGSLTIQGNYIGARTSTSTSYGNNYGIWLAGTSSAVIDSANLIGNNSLQGIYITDTAAASIQSNYIGTNATWNDRGNGQYGIYVNSSGTITIGAAGTGNWICFNDTTNYAGIYVLNGAPTIQGNYIGTNSSGTNLKNYDGIVLAAGADAVVIGGTNANEGNVISLNARDGIHSDSTNISIVIRGNFIGTATNGTSSWPNVGDGIEVTAGTVTIGDATEVQKNVIGPNTAYGINLTNGTIKLAGLVDVNDDIYLTAGAFNMQSATLNLSGNWTNVAATITPGTSTVIFDGTDQIISGSSSFKNVTKTEATDNSTDVTLTFQAGQTQTISGLLTLDGLDDNDRINLISTSGGTAWNLTANGTFAIDYVECNDSNAAGGSAISHTNTTEGTIESCTNWGFARITLTVPETPIFPNVRTNDTTPAFPFSATHSTGGAIEYDIQWDDNSNFGSPVTKTSSGFPTDAGWTAASFASGATATYTIQAADALTNGQTYFWRVRGRDPTDSNIRSNYSTARSVTINTALVSNDWFQTADGQFSTGTLSSAAVTGSGGVNIPTLGTNLQVSTSCADATYGSGYYYEWYPSWTPPGSGAVTVTKLWFWDGNGSLSGSESVKMAMYVNGGGYGKIAGSDTTITGAGVVGWISGNVTSPFQITLGTKYWFGIVANTSVGYTIYYDSGANCASYPPTGGTGTYYVVYGDYALNASVPTGGYAGGHKYGIPGITYQSTASSGTIMSPAIDFDWLANAQGWSTMNWTEDETAGTIAMKLYYKGAADCDTIVPDAALAGNSTGFASGPVGISGLNTTTYNRICAQATLTNSGGTPVLQDWTVTWATGITVGGTVYADEGSNVDATQPTVRVKVNGQGNHSATAAVNGTYSVSGVTITSASDVISVYLDTNGGNQANTITRAVDTSTDISGLHLYRNHVILRYEDAGPISNANLDQWDNVGDSDMLFTVTTNNLVAEAGSELYVLTGKTYTPGGTVSADDLEVAGTGVFNPAGNAVNIQGNWVVSATGTFTTSGTVTFDGTAASKTITAGGTDANHDFSTLTFNSTNGSGQWTMQDALTTGALNVTSGSFITGANTLTTTGTLTVNGGVLDASNASAIINANSDVAVSSGTLKAPASTNVAAFPVGGNWSITTTGIFTHSSGKVTFNAGALGKTITTSSSGDDDFWDVTFNNGAGSWILEDPLAVLHDLTISAGLLDTKSGEDNALNVAGNWSNAGTFTANGSTVTFDGTSAATYTDSAGTPQNLGAVAITKTNGTASNNKLTLASSMTANSLTISASNTLDLAGGGYTLTLAGNSSPLTKTGTLDADSNSTVKYASAAATGTTVTAATYYHLEVNKASNTFTLGGETTVAGNLTITAGALATGGYTINLGGDLSILGSFTHDNGTLNLNGAADVIQALDVSGNGTAGSVTFYALSKTLSGSGTTSKIALDDADTFTVANALTLTGVSGNRLKLASDHGSNTVDFDLSTGGTQSIAYVDATLIDSATGIDIVYDATSTATSCVGWVSTATTYTWDGSSGTGWATSANWDLGTVPTTDSVVIIADVSGGSNNNPILDQARTIGSLTINSGGVLDLNEKVLAITNALDNSGTLTASGSGTPFSAGSMTNNANSIVSYTGVAADTAVNVVAGTYYNLTINNAGTNFVIPAGTLDVNGTLTVTAGTLDLDTNDPAITTAGAVSLPTDGSSLVTKGSGLWTFDGTTATTYTDSNTTKQNIGTVAITKTNATASNNKLTLASSMTADALTISASNTLDLAGSGYILTLAGNGTAFTKTGTLDADSSSTVKYASAATTGTTVTAATYYHLEVNKASNTFTLGGETNVTGNLTITAGALSLGGYTINLGGNFSILGTFTHANGTLVLNGAADTTQALDVSGNGTAGSVLFYNLSKTLSGTGTTSTISLDDADTFTVANGLTLTGVANNRLKLVSDDGTNTVDFDLSAGGTQSVAYVDATRIDSDTGVDIVYDATSTATSCVGWVSTATTYTWDGSSGTGWATGANWDLGTVPTSDSVVVIADVSGGSTNNPVLDQARSVSALTINPGAQLDLNGNALAVTNGLANSGALIASGSGTPFSAGGMTNNANSTVSYTGVAGDTAVNVVAGTYYNLTINNAGTDFVIPAGTLNVSGDLTITAGSFKLSTNNPTVNTAGVVSIGANGSVTKGSGTWTFNGTTATTYTDSTATPQNIGTVAITKTNGTASNNKLTLVSSMTADALTISANNTLDLAGSGYTLTLAGNGTVLTKTGTLDADSNSTVKYASAATTGTAVTAATYYHLEVNKASNIFTIGSGTLDVDGNLTITAGTLATGGNPIDLAGNFINSGAFTHGNGTVTLNGTNQTVDGTTIFYDLAKTVTSAATLTLDDADTVTVTHGLTLAGASGQLLTITSDHASNTAAFILQSGGTQSLNYVKPIRINSNTGVEMNPTNSVDGTGNLNWNFGGTSGLIAHYNFDNNVNDQSGNGYNGTRVGTAGANNLPQYSTTLPPRPSANTTSLSFDGTDDYVNVADTAALRPGTSAWTTALWFNAPNANQTKPLITKRQNGSPFNQWQVAIGTMTSGGGINASKKISFILIGSWSSNAWCYYTTNDVVDGNWHHLSIVRPSSGNAIIYVDGAAVAITSAVDTNTEPQNINNTAPWRVGNDSASTYLSGNVDEVRIYNYALTAAEVSNLFSAGTTQTRNIAWSGAASTNWATAGNWDLGFVPASDANVTIPQELARYPLLSGAVSVNALTIASGASLDLNGNTLAVTGALANTGTLTVSGSGSPFSFGTFTNNSGSLVAYTGVAGDTAVNVVSGTYDDLTLDNSGTNFLLQGTTTVNDDLTLTAGSILDADSNGDTAGGTVYNLTVKGAVANFTGTLRARTNTITLFNDGVNEIKTLTTGGNTFYHLTMNHTAATTNTARISGALDINGNFILSDGTLDLDTNNVAVNTAGDVTLASGGTVTKDAEGANWTFDGTSQTFTDSNATKQDLGNVVVSA